MTFVGVIELLARMSMSWVKRFVYLGTFNSPIHFVPASSRTGRLRSVPDRSPEVGKRGGALHAVFGSMPMRSFTAFFRRCLQPRYLSVVCTLTCPSKN